MYGCRVAGYHRCMGVVLADVWVSCGWDHRCMGVVWLDIDVWVSYGWIS